VREIPPDLTSVAHWSGATVGATLWTLFILYAASRGAADRRKAVPRIRDAMACGLRGAVICVMDAEWRRAMLACDGWSLQSKGMERMGRCGACSLPRQPRSAAPDLELGRYLSAECVTCHGSASGAPASTIPNIYGRPEQALVEAVRAYRDKTRANAVMQNVAGRLKDEEIEALAAYFATIRRPP
jgi:cytochrome c